MHVLRGSDMSDRHSNDGHFNCPIPFSRQYVLLIFTVVIQIYNVVLLLLLFIHKQY